MGKALLEIVWDALIVTGVLVVSLEALGGIGGAESSPGRNLGGMDVLA